MSCISKSKIFRWKNKNVSKAVYLSRKKSSERMKKKWNEATNGKPCEDTSSAPEKARLGTRLVDLDILRDGLKCKICAKALLLDDIFETRKFGGADQFKIKCHNCLCINEVFTSGYHKDENGRKVFDINCRIALGARNAGMSCNRVNKLFADLNVPIINEHTFKRHERIVSLAVEKNANESCQDAVKSERVDS